LVDWVIKNNNMINRFKVYNYNKVIIYQCVTSTRAIHEIIEELDAMFKPTNKRYYVHCDNELVFTINPPFAKAKCNSKIKDHRTNYIYNGLWEFMEDLNIKRKSNAYEIIKNDLRYSYICEK
jgi:hypothetical protein